MTSRGCPFSCTYCSSSRIVGKKFRSRSPENVVEEMELLYQTYGLKEMEIMDDIFTLDQRRAVSFSKLLRSRLPGVRWIASSRVDTIARETMEHMKKAGCHMLYFGVESGSQHVLNMMKKGVSLERIQAAFRQAKEVGLSITGSFILGFPGETINEMWQTIRFSRKLNPEYAQYCILTPFPGTPVYDELRAKGLIQTEDWDQYTTLSPIIKYDYFGYPARYVTQLLKGAYLSFHLRPSFILKHLRLVPRIAENILAHLGKRGMPATSTSLDA